ncbi:amidohydrolase [Thermosipho ferrireducens]|uniref:Amidohydrolase n=1 Tax=Thermosipho ferrireducens TaxID=2571116 RepID=A0ABX7SB58_9BACT|nr:M20 family metallopeptidase [Thermosipho ferrireducens]QTA38595.1 amidohydrolase [Thermosipho ferrireducens]
MDSIELRHLLHQTPEIAFHEYETQRILINALKEMQCEKLTVYKIAETGVMAIYKNKPTGPFILYRADMDGLPIVEKTNWKFASKNGNMHACGHDVHMAVEYELIKKIINSNIDENFVFVFQPAEETGGGAKYVLEELDELPVKYAVALHVTDEYEFGTIASRAGTLFASATEIDITFVGKPAHIAFYSEGIDSLRMASEFLSVHYNKNFQEDVLVGFGKISGGDVRNIVARETVIMGSIRSPSLNITEEVISEISKIASQISKKYSGDFSISRGSVYPQVVVDESLLNKLKSVCKRNNFHFVECNMKFTGEDFGYFSLKYPSLLFWAGVSKGERKGLHNPEFLPEDDVIKPLAELMYNFLKELMENE